MLLIKQLCFNQIQEVPHVKYTEYIKYELTECKLISVVKAVSLGNSVRHLVLSVLEVGDFLDSVK